jgi:hypothetical protein
LASDPDAGAVLTYSATNLPASLTINTTTGLISGPVSALAGTVHTVNLSVKDQQNLIASTSFVITINASANRPPVITQPGDRTVVRKKAFSYQVIANDPEDNNAGLIYSATNLPGGLTINTTTGLISGKASGLAKSYTVTLGVKDKQGLAATDVSFKITVLNSSPAALSTNSLSLNESMTMPEKNVGLETSSLFPNPVKKHFSVRFSVSVKSQWEFILYNTAGQIFTLPKANLEQGVKTVNFDLSPYKLAPGVYYLIMTNNFNERKTNKIIID